MNEGSLLNSTQASNQAELELRRMEMEIRRLEVELPIELAKRGLRGALIGTLAGAVMLVIFAFIAAYFEKAQITGTHLCILGGIISGPARTLG